MKKLITTLVFVTAAQAFAGEVEDRLDELEMSDSLDYIRINGYLATRWDNITLGKADSLSESGEDDLSFNIHTIRLAMDFFAPVSDDFEIHVRLAGAKLTNHYGTAANWGKIHTETGSKSDLSNNMYFERAF
ncbi:hypothetical protein [Pseudobacteriovorax antillogorgiicola]|uniref:Porin n=1 Tax=Pseudobacteriovorax antillogorgiicola TaxID=1513793 RepID=A0A1Y6CW51_9BACT|nr:hypothetical protein [Pseudobacteriovorax antillogorgiicola]TCS42117.1 hypothetical protein EDD56_1448 [Pseudobacteriovorax antillogorgiicola]SMF83025.1 hypothetical protein SAMN06296036_14410 [Pseudobacteriovorax antillogorgiicola]